MLVLIWIAVVVGAVWFWFRKKYSYFKDRGLNSPPIVPLLGHSVHFMKKEHMSSVLDKLYHSFPEDRFIGMYDLVNPIVFVRDPDLLRKIGIKDFEHFADHRSFSNEQDPFFARALIALTGSKWRDMRSTLSPAFTGSKLRNMVPLMLDCNKELVSSLQQQIEQHSGKVLDVDTHDLLTRYTNDVIATCVFGLKSNSIKDRDNVVYRMAQRITTIDFNQIIKFFVVTAFPFLNKITTIKVIPEDAIDFLRQTILSTMKNREDNNLFRPDMIQLLIEARKGTLKHEKITDEKDAGFATADESAYGKGAIKHSWEDEDLVAQAFLFYFAGFDTVSTCMKFLLLELAINPDIQEQLRQEIDDYYENYQHKIDYEKISEMKYMDMVVSETLRKWPPAINTDRLCIKQYNMGKPNDKADKDFIVDKNIIMHIPIFPIHRDPQLYPNPEKFDPERFSSENKHNIKPFTYLPFGIGPRNCIGSRFALMEVKIMTYGLIRHFEVSPAPQTLLPPRYDKKELRIKLEGGHWLTFKCRTLN